MRFIKPTLAILIVASLLIFLSYFARKQVINYSLDKYLTEYQAELTCIDFSFSLSLNIIINKACLSTPQAKLIFNDISLQLTDKLQLSAIDIKALHIKAIQPFFTKPKLSAPKTKITDLPAYLTKVANLSLPVPITIQHVKYQPLNHKNTQNKVYYYGQITANKNIFTVSLKNNEQHDILSSKLTTTSPDSFVGEIAINLAHIPALLNKHQIELPQELDTNINIEGQLRSTLTWKNDVLSAQNQLDDFSINSTSDLASSGAFAINGALSWQSKFEAKPALANKLTLNINRPSEINIEYSDEAVGNFLKQNNSPTQVINAFWDNPTNGLIIKPNTQLEIDFTEQKIQLSSIKLSSHNKKQPIHLTLSDTRLSYQTAPSFSLNLDSTNYNVNSQIQIRALKTITPEPVSIISTGMIKQNGQIWQFTLSPDTQLALSNLVLESIKKDNNTGGDTSVKAEKLSINWQGDIKVNETGLTQLSIQHKSLASKVQFTDLAQLEQLTINASIASKAQWINLEAEIIADQHLLANLTLNGHKEKPQLVIYRDNLALTDLLSLKLNLPVDISLIDGSLSYQFISQLTDIENLINNDSTLRFSIKEATGEFDGFWLQELNWHQHLMLVEGNIIEASIAEKNNTSLQKANLTIASIETAPPFSNISMRTALNYQNKQLAINFTDFKANLLGGQLAVNKVQWPFSAKHSVNVQLTSIDLEQLLALDPKQGIMVTGKLSGNLPIYLNEDTFTISAGELHNISDGVIKVSDNPTVADLKASDPQLKLAFDALQNLHYHQLNADVSMDNEGYMLFDTRIKGRNPDIDNDVNLNLNLNYDLMGLLESLRITNRLEQDLIDSLQKN